jgi:hypothetical protein
MATVMAFIMHTAILRISPHNQIRFYVINTIFPTFDGSSEPVYNVPYYYPVVEFRRIFLPFILFRFVVTRPSAALSLKHHLIQTQMLGVFWAFVLYHPLPFYSVFTIEHF